MKCECPSERIPTEWIAWSYTAEELAFVRHKPNECHSTIDLKRYMRGGVELVLCSLCCGRGDVEVPAKRSSPV